LSDHKGQISLPGGAVIRKPEHAHTALREACEEVGVCSDAVRILGALTPIYVPPSDFCVQPYVAYMAHSPQFFPQPEEVAEIIEVPLRFLFDEKNVVVEEWLIDNEVKQVPFFNIFGHKVCGSNCVRVIGICSNPRKPGKGVNQG
jgi:8-oxo-dGTP pyrophosphatase MutT (NUDIX family)